MSMTNARKQKNLLSNKVSTVTMHRNGLTVEISSVAATDAGLVAQALLDMIRNLVEAGYEELTHDAGSYHGGGYDTPDEDGVDEYVETPRAKKRPLGFHVR
jgi:hypothetical protein